MSTRARSYRKPVPVIPDEPIPAGERVATKRSMVEPMPASAPVSEPRPSRLKSLMLSLPGGSRLAALRTELISRWFDWRNGVDTGGWVPLTGLAIRGGNLANGNMYYPTNLGSAKQILRDLPIEDHSRYTFVDFGSGKGRMLLIASHYPFRRVLGVEFAAELHAIAEANIARYRNRRRVCAEVRSLNEDAGDFAFPDGDLVLYFFFPFRRTLMEALMRRLERAIEAQPRDVLLVYMGNPESGTVVDGMRTMRNVYRGRHYNLYRSVRG